MAAAKLLTSTAVNVNDCFSVYNLYSVFSMPEHATRTKPLHYSISYVALP